MTKADVVRRAAREAGVSQVMAEKVLAALLVTLHESLAAGKPVRLRGFGSFTLSAHRERPGRNPGTGETIVIPSCLKARFSACREFLRALNGK